LGFFVSVEGGGSGTSSGLNENVAGALSYLVGFVTGFIFYLVEKDNRFVRYHAAQSIFVFGLVFVLVVFLDLMGFLGVLPVFGWFIGFFVGLMQILLGLLAFVLWVYLMYSAFLGEWTRVPFVSGWVERFFDV